MKKIIVLAMLVMMTYAFAYCANNETENVTGQTNANWRKLKAGMTESQVRDILGEPKRVQTSDYDKDWEYENLGRITLRKDGDLFGRYIVSAWSEPYVNNPKTEMLDTSAEQDNIGSAVIVGVIILLALFSIAFYFLPFIIAASKKKRNTGAIFVLNLLLGWTFIGWVIALVWSLTHDK